MSKFRRIGMLMLIIVGSIMLIGTMTVFANSSTDSLPSGWQIDSADKYTFPPAFELQTSAQITGGPDNFGYTWAEDGDASCSYNFNDISTNGTSLTLNDESVSSALPIGFPFIYYGQAQTEAYVSSNGFITFDQPIDAGCCTGRYLPTLDNYSNVISLFWEDFNPLSNPYPTPNEGVFYKTIGTAPNRTFIVQYNEVPHFFNGPPITAQIQLHEGTHEIDLVYQDAPFDIDGAYTSIGIENGDQTDGLTYFLGEVGPIADQVCFTPPSSLISVEKTLGLNGTCPSDTLTGDPNSLVTYCYEFTNNSTITYEYHTVFDDHLGGPTNYPLTLPPGGITTVVAGPITVSVDTVNTVYWEACTTDQTPVVLQERRGDTFGVGDLQHDMVNIDITSDSNIMTTTVSFGSLIAPTGSGSPEDVYGYFELDVDPSSGFGNVPNANAFCPQNHNVLIDYSVPFFDFLTTTTGTLNVFDPFFNLVGQAGYNFDSPDLILTFDLNTFDIDPDTVEYSIVFGTGSEPTDCANNSPTIPAGECSADTDAATFLTALPTDVSLSELQTTSRSSLMLVIVLTNILLLTLFTFYQRRKQA